MKIYTIGTNKKSAENFFMLLKKNKVKGIVDIRLNNNSQLNGFTKGRDLEYFLKVINNMEYIHNTNLAPTKEILNGYKKNEINWMDYETNFIELLNKRKIKEKINVEKYIGYCFLCSEEIADKCHRRLVVEYLVKDKNIKIKHL